MFNFFVVQLAANNIISCLWSLMESGTEELKLLQTVTLLVTTNNVVQGEALSKVNQKLHLCLSGRLFCKRLYFLSLTKNKKVHSIEVNYIIVLMMYYI